MSLSRRSLERRLIAFQALDEFMPIFPVYALLFAENGLSTAEISGLFVLWSVVTFVLEVPSGAWADTVSRRLLLCLSSVTYGAAFSSWVLFPNATGFAAGFALWGLSSALASGTFQALAYDELAAIGAHEARGREHRSEERARSGLPGERSERASSVSSRYARVIGVGTSAALVAMTLATLLAAPLMALGSYALAGWVSVAVCAAQFLVARSLPFTPAVLSVADVGAAEESSAALPEPPGAAHVVSGPGVRRAGAAGFLGRYVLALRVGTGEVMHSRVVRGGVLASAVLMGLLAFDEYFGLMLGGQGASEVAIPLLLVVVTAGQALGGLLADRVAGWSNARIGWITASAGVCLAVGALSGQPAGIVAVGVGYGALQLAIVVSDVRLQDSIAQGARATVTSVAGLLAEIVAVVVFAGFAWGSLALSLTALVAILAAVVVVLGPAINRWMPPSGLASSAKQ
ncbi:MAG: MFS transporter [Actinomycetota bacterium]|nr:MFS transporter [Actinomycetota bacterium]